MTMTMTTAVSRPRTRTAAAVIGATVLLFGASACGSDDANKTGSATGPGYEQGGPQDQLGASRGNIPGANGKVAAVADKTAQVQGMNGQVAVSWTASTTFTNEVSAALSDVKVGSCVMVGSDAQPSADSTPTEVTAANVRIMPKTDGSCANGMRGPGGPVGADGGPQLNGAPPSGAPDGGGEGGGEGGARPQVRGIGGAVGEVTAVSASGFTVASVMPGSDVGSSDGATSVTVTVDGDTTYTTTAKGSAADVKVGVCVAANGTTDDTGAVTAKTIAVSQPQDGECGGLMRFRAPDGASGSIKES